MKRCCGQGAACGAGTAGSRSVDIGRLPMKGALQDLLVSRDTTLQDRGSNSKPIRWLAEVVMAATVIFQLK